MQHKETDGSPHTRLFFTALIVLAVIIGIELLTGCKKDSKPIVRGGTYRIRPNVFNDEVFQPKDTVYAYSIYFNAADGSQYCECIGPAKWLPLGKLTKQDSLNGTNKWPIPVQDLY